MSGASLYFTIAIFLYVIGWIGGVVYIAREGADDFPDFLLLVLALTCGLIMAVLVWPMSLIAGIAWWVFGR